MFNDDSSFRNKFFIVGDSAYPGLSWLVSPFKDNGHLTQQQKKFNHLHSKTRITVEHAFGILKTRFRRLRFFLEHENINTMVNLIVAGCVLHNICIDSNDEIVPEAEELQDPHIVEHNQNENAQNRREKLFRELIARNII